MKAVRIATRAIAVVRDEEPDDNQGNQAERQPLLALAEQHYGEKDEGFEVKLRAGAPGRTPWDCDYRSPFDTVCRSAKISPSGA